MLVMFAFCVGLFDGLITLALKTSSIVLYFILNNCCAFEFFLYHCIFKLTLNTFLIENYC